MVNRLKNRLFVLVLVGSVTLSMLLANPVLANGCKPSCGGG